MPSPLFMSAAEGIMTGYHPRHRPGHDVVAAPSSSTARCRSLASARRNSRSTSGIRLGRARSGGDLGTASSATCKAALREGRARRPRDIAAIGITNQRETIVIWDKATGKPIHNAIVWQDRRTAPLCAKLKKAGAGADVHAKDRAAARPLFLRHQDRLAARQCEGRAQARRDGRAACGTVDSFLIWRLTGGKVHATDATNASRTLLYNIATNAVGRRAAEDPATCRAACCRRSRTAPTISASPTRRCSAPRSRSSASPATSRRRPSARPASSRA